MCKPNDALSLPTRPSTFSRRYNHKIRTKQNNETIREIFFCVILLTSKFFLFLWRRIAKCSSKERSFCVYSSDFVFVLRKKTGQRPIIALNIVALNNSIFINIPRVNRLLSSFRTYNYY